MSKLLFFLSSLMIFSNAFLDSSSSSLAFFYNCCYNNSYYCYYSFVYASIWSFLFSCSIFLCGFNVLILFLSFPMGFFSSKAPLFCEISALFFTYFLSIVFFNLPIFNVDSPAWNWSWFSSWFLSNIGTIFVAVCSI